MSLYCVVICPVLLIPSTDPLFLDGVLMSHLPWRKTDIQRNPIPRTTKFVPIVLDPLES